MTDLIDVIVITENWHVVRREYFAIGFGVRGTTEHMIALIAVHYGIRVTAVFVKDWQKGNPDDLASGLMTGVAMCSIHAFLLSRPYGCVSGMTSGVTC